mgnify:CR=1 FL=1
MIEDGNVVNSQRIYERYTRPASKNRNITITEERFTPKSTGEDLKPRMTFLE